MGLGFWGIEGAGVGSRRGVKLQEHPMTPGVDADGYKGGVLLGIKILDALHLFSPPKAAFKVVFPAVIRA